MKKVLFKELILKEFKGVNDFSVVFDNDITEIIGENAAGKTTLLDAIFWLFFGKNSNGETKFDLMPLDEDKNLIPGKTPTVTLKFTLDGEEIELKKVQSKSTKFFVNEVPRKAGEFKEFISQIVSEKMFMTLINPIFFCENYKWAEQKSIILDNFHVEDTIIEKKKYALIKDDVSKLGVDDGKAKYKSAVDELKKSILKLQGTKEHLVKEIGSDSEYNKDELVEKRDKTEKTLAETEKQLDGVYPLKDKLYQLNKDIDKKKSDNDQKLRDAKTKVKNLETKKSNKMSEYKKAAAELKSVSDMCTLCGSDLDEAGVKKQRDGLHAKIDKIIKEGKEFGDNIELAKLDVTAKESLTVEQSLLDEKEKLVKDIKAIEDTVDQEVINTLRVEVRDLNTEISGYDAISKNKESLVQTKKDLAVATDELDDSENMQSLLKAYHKDYSQLIADKLNEQFKNVKITTFVIQKNGEPKESFDINMYGVPYKSLNSAGKIEAGVELIQMVSKSLGLSLPLIIDNKEGCTKNFKVDNQMITMSVVKGAELHVSN